MNRPAFASPKSSCPQADPSTGVVMRDHFIRTSRLGFGTWRVDDLALAVGLWGDARVTRLIGGPFTSQWIQDRLALEISRQSTHGIQYWPLFRLSDEVHVGCCGLRPVHDRAGVLELGFHLRPEHWGHGFATEAARAVLGHAFTSLGTNVVVAGHHPENEDSRRVLQGLSFRFTNDALYAPTGLQHLNYALSAEEYRHHLRQSRLAWH
jgi:[ribosomal protein S5]-alanine N-acetyltransferase